MLSKREQLARLLARLALAPHHAAVPVKAAEELFAGLYRIGDKHVFEHRQPTEHARNLERPHQPEP